MSMNLKTPTPSVPRALTAAVVVMGVLIVVGTVGLGGVIVHRLSHRDVRPTATATGLDLPRAAGTRIESVTPRNDGTLVLHLLGPDGEELVVWDPDAGRLTARLTMSGAR